MLVRLRQEDPVARRELHPGKGVSRKCRDRDRDHGGRNGNHEAVEDRRPHVALSEHVGVVLQGDLERHREGGPPPRGDDLCCRPEAAHEQSKCRDDPDERQENDRQVKQSPLKFLRDPCQRPGGGCGFESSRCCDAHRRASTALNCLRLNMSTGTTAIRSTIATAAAAALLCER